MQHPVGIPLSREIRVTGLVSAFHTHFSADFRYEGEKHDGWEFVYVESGRIRAKAEDALGQQMQEAALCEADLEAEKKYELCMYCPYSTACPRAEHDPYKED